MDEKTPVNHIKEQNKQLLGDFTPVPDEVLEQILGSAFISNMRQFSALTDTFGLCGVAALDAAGKLAMPDKWVDVTYDAKELKDRYDHRQNADVGITAIEIFENEHRDKLGDGFHDLNTYSAITNLDDWREFISSLTINQGLNVAYFCEFPGYGAYPHWVAVKPEARGAMYYLLVTLVRLV